MADDLNISVGADITPLQSQLEKIPQIAQQVGDQFNAAFSRTGQIDQATASTSQMSQAAAEAAKAWDDLGGATSSAAASLDQVRGSAQGLIDPLNSGGAAAGNLRDALASAKQTLSDTQQGFSLGVASSNDLAAAQQNVANVLQQMYPQWTATGEGVNQVGDAFRAAAAQALVFGAGLLTLNALKDFAESALMAYANLQKFQIGLTQLTGSASEAQARIEALQALAQNDALSFPSLLVAEQRMTAFGLAQNQILPAMQAIADAAAANVRDFDQVANSFERIGLSGVAMNRQLASIGVNMKDLGTAMGEADAPTKQITADFKELPEAARFDVLTVAFEKFSGSAKAQAGGLSGEITKLHNAWRFFLDDIGAALAPMASKLAEFFSGMFQGIEKAMVYIGAFVDGVARGPAVASANLAAALSNLQNKWDAQSKATADATDAQKKNSDAMDAAKQRIADAMAGIDRTKDATALLTRATNEQVSAEGLLAKISEQLNPQILDVATAEAKVSTARDGLRAATGTLVLAETNLKAARDAIGASDKASVEQMATLKTALTNEETAKKQVQAADQALTQANKDLSTAKAAEKANTDMVAAGEKDLANILTALGIPTLKTYSEAQTELAQRKTDLNKAADTESAAITTVANLYAAGKQNTTEYKDAVQQLTDARTDAQTKLEAYKQSEKEVAAIEATTQAASKALASAQTELNNINKQLHDDSIPLAQALDDLRQKKDAERQAADNLTAAIQREKAVKDDLNSTTKDLKAATDALTAAKDQARQAASDTAASESRLQNQYGLSKTAADLLAGATVSLAAIYKDFGIKSAEADNLRIKAMQQALHIMQQQEAPLSDILQLIVQQKQAQLDLAEKTGASAQETLQIGIALQQAKDAIDSMKASADMLLNVFQNMRGAIMQSFQAITGTLVKDIFGGIDNSGLQQQITDLQSQLADTTTQYQQSVKDIEAQMAQAVADNKAQLQQELSNLQSQLDQKKQAYDQYVANYQQQVQSLQEASQQKTQQEVQQLQDTLTQEEQSYQQYHDQTIQQIQDITQAAQDNLNQQLSALQDNLAQQTESYDQFVQDTNTKLARIGEALSNQIADRTTQEQRNVQDRQTQMSRDQQDAQTQIQRLRQQETASNKQSTEQQIQDIQTSLQRKQQDAQTYIQRQEQDLQTFTEQAKEQADQQTQDLQTALDRRTSDYNDFVDNNKKQQQDLVDKTKENLNKQVAALEDSLRQRQAQLIADRIATELQMAAVTEQNKQELKKQEENLAAELAKQTADYQSYVDSINGYTDAQGKYHKGKIDDLKEAAAAALAKQEATLQASLDKQKDTYQKYVDSINGYTDAQGVYHEGKIDQIKDKFKTVWGEIADSLKSIGTTMVTNIVNAFFTPLEQDIATFLAGSFADLLGKLGFGGLQDILANSMPNAITGLKTAFTQLSQTATDAAAKINQAMTGVTPAGQVSGAGGTVGAIGQVTGSILSSVSSIVGMVTGVISAITGIISVFQNMHQENTLKSIEHNTRYSMMYLGERSDGGIMTASLKTLEQVGYAVVDLDDIKGHVWTITSSITGIGTYLNTIQAKLGYTVADLDDIKGHIWQLVDFARTGSTQNVGGQDLSTIITALDNINNTLQYDVGLGPWERTALQNINNGIVACAGWLQGIAGMPALHGAAGGGGNMSDLAKFVQLEFTTLEQWIHDAFGRTFSLPAIPAPPPLPASLTGGSTASLPSVSVPQVGGTHMMNVAPGGANVTIPITINGHVVGPGGMKQLSDMVGNVVIDRLRQNGMKY